MVFVSCGADSTFLTPRSEKVLFASPAETEDYTYELNEKNCTTGLKSFQTFYETCDALKNDELNNNCAFSKRKKLFETSYCPGEFDSV